MSWRKKWLLGIGVWTVLGLLSASQHLAFLSQANRPFSATKVFGRTMLDWYTCGVFTPAIFWVARRYRLDGRRWAAMLPIHIAACAGYILAKIALFMPLERLFGLAVYPAKILMLASGQQVVIKATPAVVLAQYLYNDTFPLLLAYAAVVGACYLLDYYERYRVLARAQLDALKAQLHPHFLFNALNALSTLVHRDPQAADRMIVELGQLLRHTIDDHNAAEVTLEEELSLAKRYVSIMQVRYGERLRVSFDVDDLARRSFVPHMFLQPLVENAIVHGIGRSAGDGSVVIRARRRNGSLIIEVEDDGPGVPEQPNERVGLRNTRALLEKVYGREQSLEIRGQNGRGTIVRVQVPYHLTPVL